MVFFVSLSEGERFTSYLVRWANNLFYCMMMLREFGGTIAAKYTIRKRDPFIIMKIRVGSDPACHLKAAV